MSFILVREYIVGSCAFRVRVAVFAPSNKVDTYKEGGTIELWPVVCVAGQDFEFAIRREENQHRPQEEQKKARIGSKVPHFDTMFAELSS